MAPVDPVPEVSWKADKLSDAEKELDREWKKEMKEWRQGEAITKQQIASSILDSLLLKSVLRGQHMKFGKNLKTIFKTAPVWCQ